MIFATHLQQIYSLYSLISKPFNLKMKKICRFLFSRFFATTVRLCILQCMQMLWMAAQTLRIFPSSLNRICSTTFPLKCADRACKMNTINLDFWKIILTLTFKYTNASFNNGFCFASDIHFYLFIYFFV